MTRGIEYLQTRQAQLEFTQQAAWLRCTRESSRGPHPSFVSLPDSTTSQRHSGTQHDNPPEARV